jgi:hypothetical protein
VETYRDGVTTVDELHEQIPFRRSRVCSGQGSTGPCHPDAGFMKRSASVQRAAIFHYTTKSHEDFERKVARGSAIRENGKGWDFFGAMVTCVDPPYMRACAAHSGRGLMRMHVCRAARQHGGLCDEPAELADLCCPPQALTLTT